MWIVLGFSGQCLKKPINNLRAILCILCHRMHITYMKFFLVWKVVCMTCLVLHAKQNTIWMVASNESSLFQVTVPQTYQAFLLIFQSLLHSFLNFSWVKSLSREETVKLYWSNNFPSFTLSYNLPLFDIGFYIHCTQLLWKFLAFIWICYAFSQFKLFYLQFYSHYQLLETPRSNSNYRCSCVSGPESDTCHSIYIFYSV